MKKAVLFLTFNRPDVTKKVFEQIKIAQPPRLYISSDGARCEKEGEKAVVDELRQYLTGNIDWECEVKTKFNTENLGCGKGVSSAINWFFENETDGIILEDDCVPSQSFFSYCEEMLEYHKDNKKIFSIVGYIPVDKIESDASYEFSRLSHCWGWASWADRWKPNYNFSLKSWDEDNLKKAFCRKEIQDYWSNILKLMKTDTPIDTWDYQWFFAIMKNQGLTVFPTKNLISNIGDIGVHYKNMENCKTLNSATYPIDKIIHKEMNCVDIYKTDQVLFENFFTYCAKPKVQKNKHYLLGFLPLIISKSYDNISEYNLFGFIPIWKIKRK